MPDVLITMYPLTCPFTCPYTHGYDYHYHETTITGTTTITILLLLQMRNPYTAYMRALWNDSLPLDKA